MTEISDALKRFHAVLKLSMRTPDLSLACTFDLRILSAHLPALVLGLSKSRLHLRVSAVSLPLLLGWKPNSMDIGWAV